MREQAKQWPQVFTSNTDIRQSFDALELNIRYIEHLLVEQLLGHPNTYSLPLTQNFGAISVPMN